MQPSTTKSSRPPLAQCVAAMVAALAMLVLAGPAAAHSDHGEDNGKRHHGKKHGKRSHHKTLDGSQGDAAGAIASFDAATGKLTIALARGDSVSGFVTEDTWIDDGDGCDHHAWSGDGDHAWDRRNLTGWDDDDRGSTDDLVPGAVVDEAILAVGGGKAVFVKIELEDDDS